MKKALLAIAALAGISLASRVDANTTEPIYFSGPNVSGSLVVTISTTTDSKYPNALAITGISGTFTDTNSDLDIDNATVTGLVGISPTSPLDPTNLLAPHDFSHFAVASGLPSDNDGFLTYDNLFWPGGAPPTASDYPGAGSFLDIYGLMFTLDNGDVVDLFSNGVGFGPPGAVFGVAVATSATALDYVANGVTASTPEPSTWAMMVLGFAGLGFAGYRRMRRAEAIIA